MENIEIFLKECSNYERRPLEAECEWYQLCVNGRYAARKCSSMGSARQQMFNPISKNCTDNLKLPIAGRCRSYKQCLVVASVSPFGKWVEFACGSGQHFDQESQQCIEAAISTCGNFSQSFICGIVLGNIKFHINSKISIQKH